MRRKALGDISNTPPPPAPKLLLSPRDDESLGPIKTLTPDKALPSKLELDKQNCPSTPGHGDLPPAWVQQLTPRTPLHQTESFLSEDVQLTPPECKAMLSAINSAVDATEVKPGAQEMPGSLEGWLHQVGITDTVSGTLKEQLQILYDRACESARLRSFMEAMKINELEMAAHEADDSARQMDLLADENTFLYEAKSSLMSDNELLRRQLQEAQARLESRVELQMQAQQQQQQQQQGQLHLLLEPSSRQAQQQQQQREQQQQQVRLASGQSRAMPPMPPTPALIHTPAMTQASTLSGTPAWVTTRQGPLAPSPGLSALSIRTPSLDETEAWMQLDASFAAQRALTPLETPSLQDALAWVDGPDTHSARPRAHQAFSSPRSALCPAAKSKDSPAVSNKGSPAANTNHSPAANTHHSPAANTDHSPAANNKDSPVANAKDAPAADSKGSPTANTNGCPAADTNHSPAVHTNHSPAGNNKDSPVANTKDACAADSKDSPTANTSGSPAANSKVSPVASAKDAPAADSKGSPALNTNDSPVANAKDATAPNLGAVLAPVEQTGSSCTDAAAAACAPAALVESSCTDAAAAACAPAVLVESSSAVTPARSAPLRQPGTAEEHSVCVSLHQPGPTAAKEPVVGVSLLAREQETVHLCVTPIAHPLKHGQPHSPTPDAQRLDVSSEHAGSQLSMVSRQYPSPVMWTDWATAAAAAGVAPDAISRAGSQMSTVTHKAPEQKPFEDIAAAAAGPQTNTDSTPAAFLTCPPALQSPTPVTDSNTTTSTMAGNATTPDVTQGTMASIATTPALAGYATSTAPEATPSLSAHKSEISFGSCGAAGFAYTSMGSTTSCRQHTSPGLVGAEAVRGAGGNTSAASHSSPAAAAASSAQATASKATPHASDQRNSSHPSSMQPEGVPKAQISTEDTVHSTPCASAQFATPIDRGGSVAFQTPLSGGASFQTGASGFASATRSVTSKPPANAWDGSRFDAASALSFGTPSTQPCEPAMSAAATHDSSTTHGPTQPHGAPSPPSSSAPLPAPQPIPFAAAFFNAFSAALESAPVPAPPPCAPAHGADAASPLCAPAAGALQLSVAQALVPAEASLAPSPPKNSPAGSLKEATGRVGNSAWALLCSDNEEEGEEEGGNDVSEAVADVEGARTEEVGEEEGNGVSEAEAAVDATRAVAWEAEITCTTVSGLCEVEVMSALDAAASDAEKVEAGTALHATVCGPEEGNAAPALQHATEPESQLQVPAHLTLTYQQNTKATEGFTPSTAQGHAPGAAPTWGILRYQETPDPSAIQAGDRTTPPCQATTDPLKPLACPWGPQQSCQSASPTLQHHAHHLRSESSTSSGGISSSGSTRYKPLCLNWCSAPNSQSRNVPGSTVHAHSVASTPSTQDINSLGVHELCSDAESGQPKMFSELDTSTPAQATKEQASMQPQQALLAGDTQQEACPAEPATPFNMSGTAVSVADANQALSQQTAAGVAGIDKGLPGQAGTMHSVLALDLNIAAGEERKAAVQHSPVCSDHLQLRAAASVEAPAELSAIGNTALSMQHSDVEAATLTATSNEWDNPGTPSAKRLPLEAAGVPEEGEAIPDAGTLTSRHQQAKRSSRWGRRVTKEQEQEIRRRAAALKIHISPYFKGSRSRRAAARVCDGQDVKGSASNLFQS